MASMWKIHHDLTPTPSPLTIKLGQNWLDCAAEEYVNGPPALRSLDDSSENVFNLVCAHTPTRCLWWGLNLSIFLKPKPSTCMISLRLIITKTGWVVCLVNQCILGRWERLISFWTPMVNVRIYFAKWTENCNFKDRKIYKYSLAANGSSLTTNDYYHWL